jgi:hypothetical protein
VDETTPGGGDETYAGQGIQRSFPWGLNVYWAHHTKHTQGMKRTQGTFPNVRLGDPEKLLPDSYSGGRDVGHALEPSLSTYAHTEEMAELAILRTPLSRRTMGHGGVRAGYIAGRRGRHCPDSRQPLQA